MTTKKEVFEIAKLAYLDISEEEAESYAKDLSSILDYVRQLEKIDVNSVEAMTHVHGAHNVFREDRVLPSYDVETALSNAPDRSGQFIRVPIIQEQLGE